jgi:hypothetical protein
MDGAKFDQLARALSTVHTRRRMMAVFGAAAGMTGQRSARGTQLGAATCGEEGAVCTLVFGCCDGLSCVTSAINTSYGICVPGDGGMVSTGTTLISPFSDTAVEEVTALMPATSSAPTTDPQAEREAHIADVRARKSANRTDQRARLDAKRSAKQLRKQDGIAKVHLGPRLKLELITSTEDDPKTDEVKDVPVDTVEVTNHDDLSIVLTRIEPLLSPKDGSSLPASASNFTLTRGETYNFVAGLTVADATDARFDWINTAACDGRPGAGYLVKAASSVDVESKDFIILCNRARVTGAVQTQSETSRSKKMRTNHQHKKKKR